MRRANGKSAEGGETLSFLQQNFGGLNDGGDRVSDLELHLFRATARDDALDLMFAHFQYDVSHDVAELQLDDFADQTVTRG